MLTALRIAFRIHVRHNLSWCGICGWAVGFSGQGWVGQENSKQKNRFLKSFFLFNQTLTVPTLLKKKLAFKLVFCSFIFHFAKRIPFHFLFKKKRRRELSFNQNENVFNLNESSFYCSSRCSAVSSIARNFTFWINYCNFFTLFKIHILKTIPIPTE